MYYIYIYAIYKSIGNIIKLNTDSGAFQAMLDSLGTLLGMGAGAAESELAMREEHFKVRGELRWGSVQLTWKLRYVDSVELS